MWFQHPLPPPHHVQCGAAAAPGQGWSWPLHGASVLVHLHAKSPLSNKLARAPIKPGVAKVLELDTAPSEAMRMPTEKQKRI